MRLRRSRSARPGDAAPGALVSVLRAALIVAAATVVVVAALASPRALAESSGAYRLVVHPGNSAQDVDRRFVAQAFLKKVTRWPNGDLIEPVDLDQRSPVRRRFSNDVLDRSVEAVKSYWQQMIFSGRALPPPEVTTDDQVIDFVLHRAGAIGYVSAGANLRGARLVGVP
jgi:hypothetical protein